MLSFYRENINFLGLLVFWLIIGIFGGGAIYLILPVTLFLLKQKDMLEEIFLGYLFILILSDNADTHLFFAKTLKNEYVTIVALFFFFDKKSFLPHNNLYKIFIPFFVFSVITMLFSMTDSYFFTSVQKTVSYFLTFLILPTFVSKLYERQGESFFKNFIMFAFTILFAGLILKFISPDMASVVGRFRGLFGGPNGLGVFCVLFFIILHFMDNKFPEMFSKQERIFLYGAILISIYLSGSRNAVVSIFIYYFFQRFFRGSPLAGVFFFAIVSVLIELVSVNASAIIQSLGLANYFRVQTLEEGSGRYIAWDFAWKQIQNNFFIGRGFAYNEFYMRQHYRFLSKLGHQGGIHNSFLTFWMDQGLVGLLIYLRSYILMFIKASKISEYAFPAMFAITFTAFFESWLVGSLSAFAFLGIFIFTIMTNEDFKQTESLEEPVESV